jgi:hypothetical protein
MANLEHYISLKACIKDELIAHLQAELEAQKKSE